jgi:phosphoglycerate dehydrogenase-like enzyme
MAPPGFTRDWFWRGASRQRAEELGFTVELNERTGTLSAEDWAEMLVGVEALLTTWGSPRLDRAILAQSDALKIVGHVGGSVANIVSADLYARGVRVCTANPLMARTVAEWALMMTMIAQRQLLQYAQFGAGGRALDWAGTRINTPLAHSTVGIWGYGDVSRALIDLLRPLSPTILVHDPYLDVDSAAIQGVEAASLEDVLSRSDVVHCLTGLTLESRGRIGAAELALIRSGATLINCGRAPLICEEALVDALKAQRFAAIMDVYEQEPLPEDHPYRSLPNVLLTPHNAGCGRDEHYLAAMLDEFARFFRGEDLQMEVEWDRASKMTDSSLLRGRG